MRNLGLNANNTLPAVFDLQRVEVLRGPQGTLFGAGSEGGTVRYITTQPSLTKFSAMAHAELACTAGRRPELRGRRRRSAGRSSTTSSVSASAPGAGATAAGSTASTIRRWRPTDNDANRVDTYVLRAALTWAPIANLTITPGIDYQKRDQHNHDEYWVGISDPSAGRLSQRHARSAWPTPTGSSCRR